MKSSYHRNRCCDPCFLCGSKQLRYDHFGALKSGEQRFIIQHFGCEIPESGCMCRAHNREAQRHKCNPEYIPAWKKDKGSQHATAQMQCIYPNCKATSFHEKIIVPSPEMQPQFSEVLKAQQQVTVCETHYQYVYRQLHAQNPCAGCGARPKFRQAAYTRHSPDANTISQYLNERTGFDGSVTATDTLCKLCYDMHLVILQHIEKQANAPHIQFQSKISMWETKLKDETVSELTRAILATVLFVAKNFQQGRALLLPHCVRVFLDNYPPAKDSDDLHLELGDGTIKFSSRWLLHQLITYLQPYMNYKSVINKIGTLLYPHDSNLLKCLSLALHDSYTGGLSLDNEEFPLPARQTNDVCVVREAADVLNYTVQEEIRKVKEQTKDLTKFNVMESIENINPLLWEFICLCTRSVRDRERSGHSSSDDKHTKTIRRYFLLCTMLFATNSSCDTTLHHLLADTVEVCGGSRELIRVLNRLGACVSADTHDRLVTSVAEQQKEKCIWSELSPDTFTVASADNIDFLQRHAAVFWGDQTRSYHGTTIQLVQPIPSLKFSNPASVHQHLPNTTANASQPPSNSASVHLSSQPPSNSASVHLPNTTAIASQPPSNSVSTLAHHTSNLRELRSESLVTPSVTIGSDHPFQPVALQVSAMKRHTSSSPANSPHKHGKVGPKRRRRTVQVSPVKPPSINRSISRAPDKPVVKLEKFLETGSEVESKQGLSKQVFSYTYSRNPHCPCLVQGKY